MSPNSFVVGLTKGDEGGESGRGIEAGSEGCLEGVDGVVDDEGLEDGDDGLDIDLLFC